MIGTYYKSCSELPLKKFIRIILSGDVSHLRKSGWAKNDVLEAAWLTIFIEYLDLTKDPRQAQLLAIMREITVSNTRAVLVYHICRQLSINPHPSLAEQLRRMGFRYDYDLNDRIKRKRAIDATIAQVRLLSHQVEQRKKDLEHLQKSGKEVTEADYEKLLTELSKFQGYRLDSRLVTVSEFASIVKRYKDHVNAMKKKKA